MPRTALCGFPPGRAWRTRPARPIFSAFTVPATVSLRAASPRTSPVDSLMPSPRFRCRLAALAACLLTVLLGASSARAAAEDRYVLGAVCPSGSPISQPSKSAPREDHRQRLSLSFDQPTREQSSKALSLGHPHPGPLPSRERERQQLPLRHEQTNRLDKTRPFGFLVPWLEMPVRITSHDEERRSSFERVWRCFSPSPLAGRAVKFKGAFVPCRHNCRFEGFMASILPLYQFFEIKVQSHSRGGGNRRFTPVNPEYCPLMDYWRELRFPIGVGDDFNERHCPSSGRG